MTINGKDHALIILCDISLLPVKKHKKLPVALGKVHLANQLPAALGKVHLANLAN